MPKNKMTENAKNSTKALLPTDPELHELGHLKRSMDRMDADYASLETLAHIQRQESASGLMTSQSSNHVRNCYRTGYNTATTVEWWVNILLL